MPKQINVWEPKAENRPEPELLSHAEARYRAAATAEVERQLQDFRDDFRMREMGYWRY